MAHTNQNDIAYMPPQTTLKGGMYVIDEVIEQDSKSLTYRAWKRGKNGAVNSEKGFVPVIIREFFLHDYQYRFADGLSVCNNDTSVERNEKIDYYRTAFKQKVELLSKIRHSNWIGIIDTFEENGTFYYVSDYMDTIPLKSYINQFGKLPERNVINVVRDVCCALRQLHRCGILHLDISSYSIRIGKLGRAYLSDFGLVQWKGPITSTSDHWVGIKINLCPPERIASDNNLGEESDIYTLGSTMFYMLTGLRPPTYDDLMSDGFPRTQLLQYASPHTVDCIAKAMALRVNDRYSSVDVMMQDLGVQLPPFIVPDIESPAMSYADMGDVVVPSDSHAKNDEKYRYALPVGTLLVGKNNSYEITKVLGQGGFGITYLANANVEVRGNLGVMNVTIKVCIKEFFMKDLNGRNQTFVTTGGQSELYDKYKRKFLEESTHLSELHHPGIVKVLEAFEGNNTYYYVMDFIEGTSLDEYIRQQNGLPLTEAVAVLKEIGLALSHMHNNHMLHLDLKPMNVMRRTDGHVVLIDFGLSKQYDDRGNPETSTTIGAGTPGYAPLEQLNYNENNDSKAFPVTMDVYALAATFYKMLTGLSPQKAADILNDGLDRESLTERGIPDDVINLIESGLSPTKRQRPQSVQLFLDAVNAFRLSTSSTLPDIHGGCSAFTILGDGQMLFFYRGKAYIYTPKQTQSYCMSRIRSKCNVPHVHPVPALDMDEKVVCTLTDCTFEEYQHMFCRLIGSCRTFLTYRSLHDFMYLQKRFFAYSSEFSETAYGIYDEYQIILYAQSELLLSKNKPNPMTDDGYSGVFAYFSDRYYDVSSNGNYLEVFSVFKSAHAYYTDEPVVNISTDQYLYSIVRGVLIYDVHIFSKNGLKFYSLFPFNYYFVDSNKQLQYFDGLSGKITNPKRYLQLTFCDRVNDQKKDVNIDLLKYLGHMPQWVELARKRDANGSIKFTLRPYDITISLAELLETQ